MKTMLFQNSPTPTANPPSRAASQARFGTGLVSYLDGCSSMPLPQADRPLSGATSQQARLGTGCSSNQDGCSSYQDGRGSPPLPQAGRLSRATSQTRFGNVCGSNQDGYSSPPLPQAGRLSRATSQTRFGNVCSTNRDGCSSYLDGCGSPPLPPPLLDEQPSKAQSPRGNCSNDSSTGKQEGCIISCPVSRSTSLFRSHTGRDPLPTLAQEQEGDEEDGMCMRGGGGSGGRW